MRTSIVGALLVAAALGVAACGGGGGGYGATAAVPAGVTPALTATPGTTTLGEVALAGGPGFVATSGFTAYILSNDTTASIACTVASGCTGFWPPIAPPAGVVLSTGFTSFTRPDTNTAQLAYNGHPLYLYYLDSGPAQTNGNNIVSYGGTWTIARP
jgi:predicted lipoprotein with Yx(FWY)xxD motif